MWTHKGSGETNVSAHFLWTGFNPLKLAPSNRRLPLPQCFRSHEKEKRRAIWSASERGRAWVLHAIGFHCNGRNGEGSQSCLWANSSPDSGKEGPTLQPSHWLDAMCAEFQLIEIGNHVPPWGSISIPQQTGQCWDWTGHQWGNDSPLTINSHTDINHLLPFTSTVSVR